MSKHHIRLHARRWSIVRKAVLERDGYRCTECGQAGRLEVDHITPLQREPGQNPYDINGLQALCRDCHIEKTRRENRRPLTAEEEKWHAFMQEIATRTPIA